MSWKQLKTYKAPKVLAKASSAETNLANEQADFYKTLTQNYAQQFAGQSNILKSLTTAFQPILQAGIGQYGFTPQEDVSMRTSASDAIANATSSAEKGLNESISSRGGGNTFLPSGAEAQLQAGLQASAASQQASTANSITQAGYATGRQNFLAASGALTNAAGLYSPTGYAGAATSAGNSAFNSADIINQQNTAWQGALTGALTGAGEAFLGGPAAAKLFSGGSGFNYSGAGAAPIITGGSPGGGTAPDFGTGTWDFPTFS